MQQTYYIHQKLASRIHHGDRDIINLQSTEDLVQAKAELYISKIYLES